MTINWTYRFRAALRVRQNRGRRDSRQFRPRLERLEDRSMLAAMISGVVSVGGEGLENAEVFLYEADTASAALIGQDTADADGNFHIEYDAAEFGSILYVLAASDDPATSDVVLAGVAGEVGGEFHETLTINELTTVATVFSLSQFVHDGENVFGPSPGLPNAVDTVFTLVDPATGTPAEVVSNFNNGSSAEENSRSTLALQTMNSLANMLAACATDDTGANCDTFFALATPPGGVAPANTIEALQNINQNPVSLDNQELFEFSQSTTTYSPALDEAPHGWLIALHFTEGGFNGPGRIAFDTEGNVWSNNNFQLKPNFQLDTPVSERIGRNIPPSVDNGGKNIAVLNNAGEPIYGSPIFGLGLNGSGYGTAVAPDGSIWIASFAGNKLSKFSAEGHVEAAISRKWVPNQANPSERVRTLDNPMGIAIDQQGNIWVPNSGQVHDLSDFGSLTVYLNGDPKQAITYKEQSLIDKPFNIAIDDQGRAWISNSGGNDGGSVTIMTLENGQLSPDKDSPITSPALSQTPDDLTVLPFSDFHIARTIAIDTFGNAWVNNIAAREITRITPNEGGGYSVKDIHFKELIAGWGLAVDSSNTVYVVSNPVFDPNYSGDKLPTNLVILVDASDPANPVRLGYISSPAIQITTAVQIDQSGNVWTVNNWSLDSRKGAIVGGDGLIKFIGLGSPTAAPLIGSPTAPAADADITFVSAASGAGKSRGTSVQAPSWVTQLSGPSAARDRVFASLGAGRTKSPRNDLLNMAIADVPSHWASSNAVPDGGTKQTAKGNGPPISTTDLLRQQVGSDTRSLGFGDDLPPDTSLSDDPFVHVFDE